MAAFDQMFMSSPHSASSVVGYYMQRLRMRQRELNVTPVDADVVVVGAGCTRSWYKYLAAESAAVADGRKATPARQLGVTGATFPLMHKLINPERCFRPTSGIYYAHESGDGVNDWVNVPFLTCVHPSKALGMRPLEGIFHDYAGRDVLMSFRGSITQLGGAISNHLVKARNHNVHELHCIQAAALLEPQAHIKKIFWAPGVSGLPGENNTMPFSRKAQLNARLNNDIITSLTYLRSHFCFQPPG
jgi:hypothetical protein